MSTKFTAVMSWLKQTLKAVVYTLATSQSTMIADFTVRLSLLRLTDRSPILKITMTSGKAQQLILLVGELIAMLTGRLSWISHLREAWQNLGIIYYYYY